MTAVPGNLFPYSTKDSIAADVAALRASFKARTTRPIAARRAQLLQLQLLMNEGFDELRDALHKDLHRHTLESRMTDFGQVANELLEHIDYMEDWAKPESVPTSLAVLPARSFIQRDPLGLVCIIGTWNYPVQLALQPLVGAISAGNTVLLRLPGDDTCVHTNNALIKLFDKYMDKQFVRLVHGGVDATKAMLEHRFDLIFCTGGEFIGKIVAAAAAKHLTPTILELGGKSPAIIDDSCDIETAARRIVWGSFMNAGQTCVRPDYLLVNRKIGDAFVAQLEKTLKVAFEEDPKKSETLARLINKRAYDRVAAMLQKDAHHVTYGGETDETERFIAPTLMNFKRDFDKFAGSACMAQEIFGPILPIAYWDELDEAIDFINEHEKPLALYAYTATATTRARVLDETSSGGVCVNDSGIHLSNSHLPFGGVGSSGMGAYHGKSSFDAFSHKKSVLVRTNWLDVPQRYFPYTDKKDRFMAVILKPLPRSFFSTLKLVALSFAITIVAVLIALAHEAELF